MTFYYSTAEMDRCHQFCRRSGFCLLQEVHDSRNKRDEVQAVTTQTTENRTAGVGCQQEQSGCSESEGWDKPQSTTRALVSVADAVDDPGDDPTSTEGCGKDGPAQTSDEEGSEEGRLGLKEVAVSTLGLKVEVSEER
jgi:hypothetical protein